MGSEQFSQAVRGSGGQPVATSAIGSLDTNDYPEGDASDEDGTTYPVTINPAETIKEIGFQIVDGEIAIDVTTVSGTTFTVPVASPSVYDKWDIDEITLRDPDNNGGRVAWWWAGE